MNNYKAYLLTEYNQPLYEFSLSVTASNPALFLARDWLTLESAKNLSVAFGTDEKLLNKLELKPEITPAGSLKFNNNDDDGDFYYYGVLNQGRHKTYGLTAGIIDKSIKIEKRKPELPETWDRQLTLFDKKYKPKYERS